MHYIKKFLKFIFAYLGFTAFLLFLIPFFFSYFKDKPAPPNSLLTIRIDEPLEEKETFHIFSFKKPLSFQKLRHVLNSALHNPNIKGVLIEADTPCVGGYAQIEELRRIIQKFKDAKKDVYFYTRQFGEGSNATSLYYLASVCSGIYMQPGGILSFMGMNIEKLFFKEFLDKIGVKFDVFKQKEYKGFGDPYLFNKFSPPVQKNLEQLINDSFTEIKKNIANDRGKTDKDIERLLERSPLMDQEAYNQGYINGVLYRNEFYDLFKKYNLVKFNDYFAKEKKRKFTKKVAVLYCEGIFEKYQSKGKEFVKGSLNERGFEKQINRIIAQKYDGIILRINSSGGSATVVEAMYGVLSRAKQKGIKIVVSMGDVAASAGYFIACASDKVVAEPLTITGSIGVILTRLNIKGTLEKIGMHSVSLGEGENTNMYSIFQELTNKQREKFMAWGRYSYDDFVSKVAKFRGKTVEEIDDVAKGQVWTGRTAYKLGLIDALGGMETAQEQMNQLLGAEAQYIDIGDGFEGLLEQLMGELSMCMSQGIWHGLKHVVMNEVESSVVS